MSTEFNPMEDLLADLLSTWDEEPAAEGESRQGESAEGETAAAPARADARPEPLTPSSPAPSVIKVVPPLPVISALPAISALRAAPRPAEAEPPVAVTPVPEPVLPEPVLPEPVLPEPVLPKSGALESATLEVPAPDEPVSGEPDESMFDLPVFDSPIFQPVVLEAVPEPETHLAARGWAEDPGAAAACAAILARMEREFAEREPVSPPVRKSRLGSDAPRFVVFVVREMMFAVPIGRVLETDRMTPVTPLPGAALGVKGLTNLRGDVVPVIDLRDVLGWAPPENPTGRRMLVIQDGNHQPLTALLVDQVKGLAAFPATAWKSTAMAGAHAAEGFVEAVAERDLEWVSRLNLDRILNETHLPSLAAA